MRHPNGEKVSTEIYMGNRLVGGSEGRAMGERPLRMKFGRRNSPFSAARMPLDAFTAAAVSQEVGRFE